MLNGTKLELGFIRKNNVKDEVLMELLDHLGIIYSEGNFDNFSCLIASTKLNEQFIGKNVIIADEIIPLDDILYVLSGNVGERGDSFNLIINDYEKKILDTIRNIYHENGLPLVRKWFWPNFAKACCVLTHDVDWLTYSPFHRIMLRIKSPAKILSLISQYLFAGRDYGYNIPEILALEVNRNVKSTFFFMTEYGEDNIKGREAERLVKESGFEIGLHGSRGSHKDLSSLRTELNRIRTNTSVKAEGIRFHQLKFEAPLTWKIINDAGLAYDATYSDHNFGFRVPLCYPFHPIDRVKNKRYNIFEIPTVFMDWIALNRKFTEDQCKGMLNKIMTDIEKYNGCFAVNFHNTYFNIDTFNEIYGTYIWLIDNLVSKGYWVTSAIDCCRWLATRANVKINVELRDRKVIGTSSFKEFPVAIEKASSEMMYSTVDREFILT